MKNIITEKINKSTQWSTLDSLACCSFSTILQKFGSSQHMKLLISFKSDKGSRVRKLDWDAVMPYLDEISGQFDTQ